MKPHGIVLGVDERRRDLAVRHAIGTGSLVIAVDESTWFEGRIGPGIDQIVHLVRRECAVALDATLEVHLDRVPGVARKKFLDIV